MLRMLAMGDREKDMEILACAETAHHARTVCPRSDTAHTHTSALKGELQLT